MFFQYNHNIEVRGREKYRYCTIKEGQGEKLGAGYYQNCSKTALGCRCSPALTGFLRFRAFSVKPGKSQTHRGKLVILLGTSEISPKDTLSNFKSVVRVHCSQSSTNLSLPGYQLVRAKCSRGQG